MVVIVRQNPATTAQENKSSCSKGGGRGAVRDKCYPRDSGKAPANTRPGLGRLHER